MRSDLALAIVFVVASGCATTAAPAPSTAPASAPVATPPVEPATPDAGVRDATDVPPPPDATAPTARAPTPQERQAAEGSAVFFRVCGPCHAAMWSVPTGGTLTPSNQSEASVRRQIRGGSRSDAGGGMPAIGTDSLPEREMPALLAYLRSIHVVAEER